MRLVVQLGVPSRIPEVSVIGLGSKGIVFLFTMMSADASQFDA
jgi:hypothetical protein